MSRKIPTLRAILQTKTLAHPAHRIKIKGAAAEAEGEATEAEVATGAEAIKRKESGTAFFTKRLMTTTRIIAQTRKGLKPFSKKRRKKRRGTVQSIIPLQPGRTQTLGGILSPILFNHLTSHHLSQATLNHYLGNPRPSKLKTLSVDPLTSTPSLLLLPHTKAQPLHLYQQSLRAKQHITVCRNHPPHFGWLRSGI
jgi:hypothetical protein